MMKTAREGTQRLVQGQITITRDGHERNLSVRVSAEQTSQSRDSYIITLDDITELVSAQRTSAWADVARRIAHEIKNPLTPIQLSAERIRRKFGKVITEDKAIFEQCTDTIVRQVDDIRRMVDEFSRFARMPKPVIEGEDVADTVRQAVFLMRVGHPEIDIEAEIRRGPDAGAVRPAADLAGADQHHQERHRGDRAVPAGGTRQGTHRRVIAARENDDIVIDVIDNGIGLPKVSRAAAARTLCHDARKGHRPWARHRRPRSGRPWRRDRTQRCRRHPAGPARGLDAAAFCRLGPAPKVESKRRWPKQNSRHRETSGPADATNSEAKIEAATGN